MSKTINKLVRNDKGFYSFTDVGMCLAQDLSDTVSIEAERMISAVDDAIMIDRYINANMLSV